MNEALRAYIDEDKQRFIRAYRSIYGNTPVLIPVEFPNGVQYQLGEPGIDIPYGKYEACEFPCTSTLYFLDEIGFRSECQLTPGAKPGHLNIDSFSYYGGSYIEPAMHLIQLIDTWVRLQQRNIVQYSLKVPIDHKWGLQGGVTPPNLGTRIRLHGTEFITFPRPHLHHVDDIGITMMEVVPSDLTNLDSKIQQLFAEAYDIESATDCRYQIGLNAMLPGLHMYVFFCDQEPIGLLVVNHKKEDTTVSIEKFYIREDMRGRGIGSWIIAQLIDDCGQDKAKAIKVMLSPIDISSQNFYDKCGFNPSRAHVIRKLSPVEYIR